MDKIAVKCNKFEKMTETVRSIAVSEPIIAGKSFAVNLKMDITMKGQGRMNMEELCVYEIKDGKIISEQFYM